jgi:GntR family uxuAB operon transcriptional repressor
MMNQLMPVNRQYQEVGQRLIEKLNNGDFCVGDRLPAERVIADEMGVSRAVIREAMIMLELFGLVEVKKGSGIYIVSLPDQSQKYTLEKDNRYQKEHVGPFEMLQARQVIESRVAELAAMQITKKDILKLREALAQEKMEVEAGKEDIEGDHLFHRYIAEATQNSVLIEIIEGMWASRQMSPMWQKLHQRIGNKGYQGEWYHDHAQILTKLQQKDAKGAGYAMWLHLENVKNKLMELSDVDDPDFDGFIFNVAPSIEVD